MTLLELKPLTLALIPAAVSLDRECLGGLWNEAGYQREVESPNSDLLGLFLANTPTNRRPPSGNANSHGAIAQNLAPSSAISLPENRPSASPQLIGLGCLWAILTEAHLTLLAIHPNYRRQGFGQMLLCTLLQSARQRGLEWATLEVRASNHPALALYQQFGFQEAGQRRRYYQDTGEDALILWRSQLQSLGFAEMLQHWQQKARDRITQHNWQLISPCP